MSKYQSPRVNVNMNGAKIVVGIIILLIIVGVVVGASIKIVESGNRGVLTSWSAIDVNNPPLDEGIHFVIPFQDEVIQVEVRTLKYDAETRSASMDLQNVQTTVTVNYHPDPEKVNLLFKEVGLNYESRIIQPAIEETVKQVTANYNAEELITKRPLVKADIENAIRERLNQFYVQTEVISITDFEFSILFAQAIESKVEAEQKAKKAENDLIRIEVEARQLEAQAVGLAAANIEEARGEAEAISIINSALSENPYYLEWLKTQAWDGKLPLVVGEGGTPFIAIPTQP
ncbi:MAG: prohibitin family protein [Crenarchaeota archaeon]|nr:prohibitin family protein [Thermoproteota archaeon]MDA0853253.1 prohibitin family protein [Thermoproteota archaeon]MDA1123069.1 prohibitin family protein [Thermoproteota archaeon]HJJ23711.1 prohibitin family protein [Nitrosopumilus sp.]HJJ25293.1 prohibitin family protein [Nitrosopumilus sp.]